MSSLLGLSYGSDDDTGTASGRNSLRNSTEDAPIVSGFSIVAYGNDEDDAEAEAEAREQSPPRDTKDDQTEIVGEKPETEEESVITEKDTETIDSSASEASVQSAPLNRAERLRVLESLLPPKPRTPCDPKLLSKVAALRSKVMKGMSINEKVRHGKDFKNPYLLNWLVEHCDIDEIGSNYPPHLFDPHAIRDKIAILQQKEEEGNLPPPQPTGPLGRAIGFAPGTTPATAVVVPNPTAGGIAAGGGSTVLGKRPISQVKKIDVSKKKSTTKGAAQKKSKWDQTEAPKTESTTTEAPPPAPVEVVPETEPSAYAQYVQRKRAGGK